MNEMRNYERVLDGFEAMLAKVPADRWEAPSACREWTVRDVAGHGIWGQEQMRHWATGQEYAASGGPGSAHPGELTGADPVATWRRARERSVAALTGEALARTIDIPELGRPPLAAMVTLLVTDLLAHTWDIGHALGAEVVFDPDLVAGSMDWARRNVVRAPGFFGPELTPPADGDEQTRWLAFLGRAAWQPVSA